ncbi:hypothetical protein NFI96_027047 [Prochilodus magdalenae]|nr:hypothetical protein NFI96_027047 [Prochilodus magdalenae]
MIASTGLSLHQMTDSLAVEISSYLLPAVLTTSEVTAADLGYANRIVSWLVRQQNPYGGFSSTQAEKLLNLVLVARLHHGAPRVLCAGRAPVSLLPLSLRVWTNLRTYCFLLRLLIYSYCFCPLRYFMVTFPAVIESGSVATLCMSLLKPSESLLMTIYLVHNDQDRTFVQERVEEEFHRCSQFKAPQVKGRSVQEIRVEVKGESFQMTEKRKVMFKSYDPLTFIQTDKPIYIPGQTDLDQGITELLDSLKCNLVASDGPKHNVPVVFYWIQVRGAGGPVNGINSFILHELPAYSRHMSLGIVVHQEEPRTHCTSVGSDKGSKDFIPMPNSSQGAVVQPVEDNKGNRIGQWTNVSSGLIVQLSHKLNPEASEGMYNLKANIGDRSISHRFKVKKYVLPRFEITVKAPKSQNAGEEELKIEVCGKYTYGQPVPGDALVRVCLKSKRLMISPCVNETVKMEENGCASPVLNISVFIGYDSLDVTVTLTEEGTDISMKKTESIDIDYQIGKVEFLDLPKHFERKTVIEGKASVYPGNRYIESNMPFFAVGEATIPALGPATPHSPEYSELSIETLEEPLRCGAEISINIKYYIVGETTENYSADVVHMVVSKGAIVRHGYEKVEVKESKKLIEGKVSFKLSVDAELAPVVQVLVYCVLPSGNIIAASRNFNVEKCFRNKVSLQFSPSEAVPGEDNSLQLSALPGSLCGVSAVDQSVYILEEGTRLDADMKFSPHLSSFFRKNLKSLMALGTKDLLSLSVEQLCDSNLPLNLFLLSMMVYTQIPVTVPDTITTWETEAFCLSSRGLGVAPSAQLRVFQPFFLELSLPYSIIRGEEFELKATVFNYLSKCIMVKVTPAPSPHYTLKASSDGEYSSCLCANGRKTFKWTLVPSVLGVLNVTVSAEAEQSQAVCDNEIVSVPERGRIDTVTRSLLVKAEGTEKTKTQSWLLCPQGDILGRALKNIDGLLKMPYGCGEQNIALLAPNIYILQYLENTEQLTAAIRERATGFLKSGYQRQLNYKHYDGAYSTFGTGEGNTWLTAFVLRTFGKAQRYIFIDPQNINKAKQWLISKQRPDGCFIRQGRLFNNRMKGGVNDDVTITAYITASLLELGSTVEDPVVSKGLSCLKSSIDNLTNTYTTALLAYTFSLAGEKDTRAQLLDKLNNVAISGDDRLHWSQSASDDSDSLAVEISSYVLLAVLTTSEVTAADLGYANRIVSWLVRQQNPYGGFSSTQDTVVALQALALYSTKVFGSDGSSTVTVKSDKESHSFDVNQDNKLLFQEKPLTDVPGKYSVSVEGSTCVSVQGINRPLVERIDSQDDHVIVYLKKVPRDRPLNYQLHLKQVLPVKNLKPAVVKVYDYYQTKNLLWTERRFKRQSSLSNWCWWPDFIMVVRGVLEWKGLLLACFLFLSVYGQTSGPYFMVTFPAVIESGSEATLCTSLLKPNESLQITIYLANNHENRTLLQEKVEEEFHRCSQFKAPQVSGQSVQEIRVEVEGESFQITEKRKVMFKSYNPLTFIQTDKPIYNPGQTVNFRIVTMDANFVPLEQEYSVVTLEDHNGNRIGQWTNVSSTRLIVQLSHQLNSEAPQGLYKLQANIGDRVTTHNFKVKKYVLPRFEITLNAPEQQSVVEEDLKIEICAKYTYGQPVPGKVLVQVCRKFQTYYRQAGSMVSPCLTETVEMEENGCASSVFNMSIFIKSEFEQNLKDSIDFTVTVTEEGTDISMEKSGSTEISYEIGKVEFVDLPKNFERDTVIEGKIKLTDFKKKPIPDKKVYLLEGHRWSPKLLQNLTTDENGLANFSVNAPNDPVTELSLLASVYVENQYQGHRKPFFRISDALIQLLQPATPYSPVYSELSIEDLEEPLRCGAEISLNVKYYIVGENAENYKTDIVHTVLSKGAIVHHGYEKVEVKESKKLIEGKVSFKLTVDVELAPVVQVLVYCVLPSENIIAASKNFNVEKCFRNKVSLEFSPSEAVPGEENSLQLSALPGSLCGLSGVDQSVFIMEQGKRLNAEEIFNLLPVKSVSQYSYEVEDELECLHVRPRRNVRGENAYSVLKSVGLKMATNLDTREPQCLIYKGLQYHRGYMYGGGIAYRQYDGLAGPVALGHRMMKEDSEVIETVRKFFPETWIWQLAEVGDSGSAQIPVTVPDTITTWETEAFCLSSRGLGVAPSAQLRVFQPFFLELSLPYSIIRGEEFELKATVFNYLSKCIMVKVTPAPSPHYTLKASSDGEYSSCLCANGRKTFKWTLVPSVLGVLNVTVSAEADQSQAVCDNEIVSVPERGRIDTVTRSLLVQAEGSEKTRSQSWLLCPQGNSVSEKLELLLPENVIKGSGRASVSVLGDILGRALKNIDGLLAMPYGCGEQNIALLAPNIYILQYLENTEQLTAAIRERATGFLKSGYQRQLNYKHYDGAYSTFGTGEGNTWLTAFVLRTFGKAQRYIFIDPQNINKAKQWLISKQRPDGCFIRQGRLFNNRMKGGVNDDVTITAYITASLLELGSTVEDPVVSKGLSCLKSSLGNLTNTYATALLAYTFSLAAEKDTRAQLLNKLNNAAISGDNRLHWSQSASDDSDSLAVEISSYVLLAVLTTSEVTAADLGYANRIVSWLVRQQNPYGGFSSTQDTVVALQALALYSTKVFSSDGSSTVTVKSDKESHSFDVNQDNKLLYQEKPLTDVPGNFSVSVEGSTCVSVQMALFYNIPTPAEPSTLSIKAKAEGKCTKPFGYIFSLNFTVSYDGELNSTNMVIVDIKILSGFTADPSDLKNRGMGGFVERVDSKDDHIIMYMKEVPKNIPMNYQLHLKQVLPVKNLKPAVIKVYDYYQTSDQSETEYSSPCV